MATPQQKNSCPGDHEIYYFVRLFHGYHYYTLCLSKICQLPPLGLGEVVIKYLDKIDQVVLVS